VLFGVGQTLGPYLAGAVSDAFGGLDAGLWVCAVLLAIGAGVTLLQPAVGRPAGRPT
jgi:predicted MFS family arabinose efflux permease